MIPETIAQWVVAEAIGLRENAFCGSFVPDCSLVLDSEVLVDLPCF